MTQKFRFHKLVHKSLLTGGVIVKNQDFDVLMISGYVRAEELCLSKIARNCGWASWHLYSLGSISDLDDILLLHIHMTSWWGRNERKVFFCQSTCFRCMEIDAKVNEFYLWHGTHIRAALSIAREAKGLCPGWIVLCTLWHHWKKEDSFMHVFFLLRCELLVGRAFFSNNICFHAFFHAFTVACGRTSE